MNPTASLALDRATARLSDTVAATLTVEGPAPLAVGVRTDPLADDTAAGWTAAAAGPPRVTVLPDGRERWEQTFTLSPFLPGDGQAIQFAPVEVSGRVLEVPPASVSVRTSLTSATPADARPVTGPEPPPAGPDRTGFGYQDAVPVVSVVAVLLLAVAAWRAGRRKPVVLPPRAWVHQELDSLDRQLAAGEDTALVCERLAAVLRLFIERESGLPAGKRTTDELLAASAEGLPLEPLRPVFERCDLAKFAGRVPTADEGRELIAQARAAVG